MYTIDLCPTEPDGTSFVSKAVPVEVSGADIGVQSYSSTPFIVEGSCDGETFHLMALRDALGSQVTSVPVQGIYRFEQPIVTQFRIRSLVEGDPGQPYALFLVPTRGG